MAIFFRLFWSLFRQNMVGRSLYGALHQNLCWCIRNGKFYASMLLQRAGARKELVLVPWVDHFKTPVSDAIWVTERQTGGEVFFSLWL